MCERRYGRVILLQSSDAEISGAIARGMLEARGDDTSSGAPRHLPLKGKALEGETLEPEQIEVVEAEIDRQRIVASLVRVAVGNDRTAEDYSVMVTRVRGLYGRYSRPPGPLRRALRRLLGVSGLLVCAVSAAYQGGEWLTGNGRGPHPSALRAATFPRGEGLGGAER